MTPKKKSHRSLLLILLLLGVLLIAFSFAMPSAMSIVQTDSTFGFSILGTYNGDYTSGGVKEAQRVQMGDINGASVTKISFYCWTETPADVKCAIYSDNDGVPGDLLATTNEVFVDTAPSWVDFPLSTSLPVYATYCYWLTWMSSVSVHYTMQGGGEYSDGYMDVWNYNGYGDFSNSFGEPTQTLYGVSTNIYATFTTSQQNPTPTPLPTPTPTLPPTTSPTPAPGYCMVYFFSSPQGIVSVEPPQGGAGLLKGTIISLDAMPYSGSTFNHFTIVDKTNAIIVDNIVDNPYSMLLTQDIYVRATYNTVIEQPPTNISTYTFAAGGIMTLIGGAGYLLKKP